MGLLGHGVVDFTLWIDPMLYPSPIAAGLLGVAAEANVVPSLDKVGEHADL